MPLILTSVSPSLSVFICLSACLCLSSSLHLPSTLSVPTCLRVGTALCLSSLIVLLPLSPSFIRCTCVSVCVSQVSSSPSPLFPAASDPFVPINFLRACLFGLSLGFRSGSSTNANACSSCMQWTCSGGGLRGRAERSQRRKGRRRRDSSMRGSDTGERETSSHS